MKPAIIWSLLKATFREWNDDKAPRLGAALAYYSVFSLAPLLVIAAGIASLVLGERAARGEIAHQLQNWVGEPAASAIARMLENSNATGGGTRATVIGLALLLFGASGVFIQLQDALNTIWKVTPRPGQVWWSIVRDRLLSFTLVLGTGLLLLVSVVVTTVLTALGQFLTPDALPASTAFWQFINNVVSFAFTTVAFALIYKILPDAKIAWRDVWVGGAVTALLFTAGKYVLGLYLGQSSTTSAFGAAGSLVVILLWVYYSAQILLFGAEFTRTYANCFGRRVALAENAVAVTPEARAREGMPCHADVEAHA